MEPTTQPAAGAAHSKGDGSLGWVIFRAVLYALFVGIIGALLGAVVEAFVASVNDVASLGLFQDPLSGSVWWATIRNLYVLIGAGAGAAVGILAAVLFRGDY